MARFDVVQREDDPTRFVLVEVYREAAVLLTGRPDARARDLPFWLDRLRLALQVPGLATFGLTRAQQPAVIAAARAASSMKANPVELNHAELSIVLDLASGDEASARP